MVTFINSASLSGMEVEKILVEVDISAGLPDFRIVGIADSAVRESRERIRAAIKNSGFQFPVKKIIVNLAPAELRKEGPIYDLPIAIGILRASGQIADEFFLSKEIEDYIFMGELGLDGRIRGIRGVLAAVLHFADKNKDFVLPASNCKEALLAGIDCHRFTSLKEVADWLNQSYKPPLEERIDLLAEREKARLNPDYDFSQVKGQLLIKRGIEVAVAGGHNFLVKGSPGTGKSMLAKCIPGIMPDLTYEEMLEITKIYSIAGELNQERPFICLPPYRNPHHSTSLSALAGGGTIPKPGEVSLSHLGLLFLDEIAEYQKRVLESLREPIEDGSITISRLRGKNKYPANFILGASMNPCPCGYLGSEKKACSCSPGQIEKYKNKLSGPLLDRIDIFLHSQEVPYEDIKSNKNIEDSRSVKKRIEGARAIQRRRFAGKAGKTNSLMSKEDLEKYCKLDKKGEVLMEEAYKSLDLSLRAYDKILKVARTIADLKAREEIQLDDLAEAIQYRKEERD